MALFSLRFHTSMAALLLVMQGCVNTNGDEPGKPLPFKVIEGVQELTVIDAKPDESFTLFAPGNKELLTLITDKFGQAHYAYLPETPVVLNTGDGGTLPTEGGTTLQPGFGYVIRRNSRPPVSTGKLRVLSIDDHPPVAHYEKQRIYAGHNYIEMRDGIQLSATVWFPNEMLCGQGPYPTVMEYSGYGPANPDSPQPGMELATQLMCFVSVGVDLRGSGCSGGVFDVFNPAQHADGYDAIEVVARQPFVKFGKVGMVGLSYPGITQLYVAYTNPPHLASIAPLSVIEDPWRQAWPGGIYNEGFTRQWVEARDRYAKSGGADWSQKLIKEGDKVCEANQRLRLQNVNFEAFSKALSNFPEHANERRLSKLVPRINVPVFLTGAWQDEQTGSRFATMLDDFTNAPIKRFTMFNGRHPDGYTPLTLTRLAEFLSFYVAQEIPLIHPLPRVFETDILESIFSAPGLRFERDRFTRYADFKTALAVYEAEPEVRILFESGYGSDFTEAPIHRFEKSFAAWPPKATARVWYLGPDGNLLDTTPPALAMGDTGVDAFHHEPDAGAMSYLINDGLFEAQWEWLRAGPGYALSYTAAAFAEDTLVVGNGGFAHLWFASDATDANVEISLLEVRPDDTEYLVQTGVFAVKHRLGADTKRSEEFLKEYTYHADKVSYLDPGVFVEVDVPIQPFSHAFRAGTKLRLVIDTPGRDAAFWEYTNPVYTADVIQRVARDQTRVSYIKLPILTGTPIPNPAPPCHSLRGIVCGNLMALPNTTVTP